MGITSARWRLQELQAKCPPAYSRNKRGIDRAESLAEQIIKFLPPEIIKLIGSDQLVIGEVGDWVPSICTYVPPSVEEGNFIIAVNSGVMDFYYAIARAVHGRTILHGSSGTIKNDCAISFEAMFLLFRSALTNWREMCDPGIFQSLANWLHQHERIQHGDFVISEDVRDTAESMTTNAELFMLAHEFGHVALKIGAFEPVWNEEESDADTFAVIPYLHYCNQRDELRMAMAGMGLAVRVTGSLAQVGVKFSRAYPPPCERLDRILSRARQMMPSERCFDEASTIMVSVLDQMDHVDEKLDLSRSQTSSKMLEWQTRVRMIAILEEVAKQTVSVEEMKKPWVDSAPSLPPGKMTNVHKKLVEYYDYENPCPAYLDTDLAARMGRCLKEFEFKNKV
jgi:hypothetical protein